MLASTGTDTTKYQFHLIWALKKSCAALSAELKSSHQTWSLSYLWLIENLYNTYEDFIMIFSYLWHKCILLCPRSSSHFFTFNIPFQMRIHSFVSVLAYFATTMVCEFLNFFPIFFLIAPHCNFHAQSVMHAFVWTS